MDQAGGMGGGWNGLRLRPIIFATDPILYQFWDIFVKVYFPSLNVFEPFFTGSAKNAFASNDIVSFLMTHVASKLAVCGCIKKLQKVHGSILQNINEIMLQNDTLRFLIT